MTRYRYNNYCTITVSLNSHTGTQWHAIGTTITAPLLLHLIVTQVRNDTLSVQPLLHHYRFT